MITHFELCLAKPFKVVTMTMSNYICYLNTAFLWLRILISSVLRSTQRLILKNEADGELGETAETTTSPTSESKMAAQRLNSTLSETRNICYNVNVYSHFCLYYLNLSMHRVT